MLKKLRHVEVLALLLTLALPARLVNGSAQPESRPFLWKVQSAKGIVYLLGSVHAAKSTIYPLNEQIEKAFNASDTLVVEVNISDVSRVDLTMEMMSRASYPDEDTLDKHLSPELWELASSRLGKNGLPIEVFKKFRPWFIAAMLELMEIKKLGITPENGIDQHFLNLAKGKKKILELESVKEQMDLLSSFSEKEDEAFLKYTLKDLESTGKHLDEIMAAWQQGNAERLNALLIEAFNENKELSPLKKKLIDDRNKQMASRIEDFLNTQQTYFVVVGAGHLVGSEGLLKNLSKKYTVRQL